MNVSSTGAVLCAVRTAWRPWTCTHAKPQRAPTGRLPHDLSGGHRPPSLLQGLHRICKDMGPRLLSGRCFLRPVAFVSAKPPLSLEAPGLGHMRPTGRALLSPLPVSGAHLSLVLTGLLEGTGVGPDRCSTHLHGSSPEQSATGRKSVSKEFSLCFPINAHS